MNTGRVSNEGISSVWRYAAKAVAVVVFVISKILAICMFAAAIIVFLQIANDGVKNNPYLPIQFVLFIVFTAIFIGEWQFSKEMMKGTRLSSCMETSLRDAKRWQYLNLIYLVLTILIFEDFQKFWSQDWVKREYVLYPIICVRIIFAIIVQMFICNLASVIAKRNEVRQNQNAEMEMA